jgi:hypothetical protein
MTNLEAQAHLSEARGYASAAAYDIQQFPPDTESAQALHNLQSALDAVIETLASLVDPD